MKKVRGFSILQLMLCSVVAVVVAVGVFKSYQTTTVSASVRQEQKKNGLIIDEIEASFRTAPNYTGVSVSDVNGSNASSVGIGTGFSIRAADVRFLDDAFDLTYSGLSNAECVGLVPALNQKAYNVFINNNPTIVLNGRVLDETAIATQCSGNSTVVFRYYTEKNTVLAGVMPDEFAPPPRPTPPTPPTVVNPVDPPTPVAPSGVGSVCLAQAESRVRACPSGQVGGVLERRSSDCAGVWGGWSVVSNSCAPSNTVASCTPTTERQVVACPTGQGGQEIQERTSSCSVAGVSSWGAWKTVNSTCTAACVANGNCCIPTSRTQTVAQPCAIGSFGSVSALQKQSTICTSATATPYWGTPWQNVTTNGSCASCPSDSVTYATRWVDVASACSVGSYGSNVQQQEQRQQTYVAYNCNASAGQTTATPTTTVGGWSVTGSTRPVSSCSACPSNTSTTESNWVSASGACPAGQTGTQTWEAEQQRTVATVYNCNSSAGQTSAVASATTGTWGSTGAVRNVNTSGCASASVMPTLRNKVKGQISMAGGGEFGWTAVCNAPANNMWPVNKCLAQTWVESTYSESPFTDTQSYTFKKAGQKTAAVDACLSALGSYPMIDSTLAWYADVSRQSTWPSACSCDKIGGISIVFYGIYNYAMTDAAGSEIRLTEYSCP